MSKIATKLSWHNHPIDYPKWIDIELHFTETQFLKLIKGLIHREMKAKWFFTYHLNEWLYFYWSWTGYGIFKAKLNKENDAYNEFCVKRNQEKYYNVNDQTDIETFSFLITSGLLGIYINLFVFKLK